MSSRVEPMLFLRGDKSFNSLAFTDGYVQVPQKRPTFLKN